MAVNDFAVGDLLAMATKTVTDQSFATDVLGAEGPGMRSNTRRLTLRLN